MEKKQNIFKNTHAVWHKFSNWLIKTYGQDLHGKWQHMEIKTPTGKTKKIKFRNFNDYELNKRLVGYEVMCRVNKYITRCCPEIKAIRCDDASHAGSDILLIPHPAHGITVIFIPQCTNIQNQFFLYENHYNSLIKELKKMKSVYKNSLIINKKSKKFKK